MGGCGVDVCEVWKSECWILLLELGRLLTRFRQRGWGISPVSRFAAERRRLPSSILHLSILILTFSIPRHRQASACNQLPGMIIQVNIDT